MPLKVQIVTPERQVLVEDEATFVLARTLEGELGVLPGIAPVLAALGTGPVKIEAPSGITRMFIDGGFLIVKEDRVTILAEYAVLPADLDVAVITGELEEYRRLVAADSGDEKARKELARREALHALIQIG